ncbi:MAG: Na/Pi symporter [Opitutales bacterium]|nr:Na/Pi symporter [Opitutales bacterium]MCH8539609.1 Na/Pi symporter [Opitutales bacterium]
MSRNNLLFLLKVASIFVCLYLFVVGVGGMGEAFKLFGKDFANRVLTATSNPLTALFIGILATSLVQSSSTSTSIIVGMVAGGALSLEGAVFMIMGANIGTSITSMLVALGHANRPEEFRRAFSASTVHSAFNLCAATVLFPLELATGYLRHTAKICGDLFEGVGGMRLSNPLKAATEPTIDFLAWIVQGQPILLLVLTIILTYGMLLCIVKLLRSLVLRKLEAFFDKHLFRNWRRAMFFGLFFTFAVQTSSVPTALVVPLAAAGILRLAQVYPYCLGSNMGTTMTAMLAALATGNSVAIVAAFSHLLFNVTGILVIWSIPPLRRIPMRIAEFCGNTAFHKRWFPFAVVAGLYFIIPFLGILILP